MKGLVKEDIIVEKIIKNLLLSVFSLATFLAAMATFAADTVTSSGIKHATEIKTAAEGALPSDGSIYLHEVHEGAKADLWYDSIGVFGNDVVMLDSIEYDTGVTPSITRVTAGKYAGYMAEVHQSHNSGTLWFSLISDYNIVVHTKYEDDGSSPSITTIQGGTYNGCIAEVHVYGDGSDICGYLWYGVIDPASGYRLVNVNYDHNGSYPSITAITSGKYAGCVAEVHQSNTSTHLWYNVLSPSGENLVHVKYDDNGSCPSITTITSGKYAGYIAEVHNGNNGSLWYGVIDPASGNRLFNVKYDNGVWPSVTTIHGGAYDGCLAEVHASSSNAIGPKKLWFDVINPDSGERLVSEEYDQGYWPCISN